MGAAKVIAWPWVGGGAMRRDDKLGPIRAHRSDYLTTQKLNDVALNRIDGSTTTLGTFRG